MAQRTALALLLLLLALAILSPASSQNPETSALLNFRKSLSNDAALTNWNGSTDPCTAKNDPRNWVGVLCSNDGRSVQALQLESMGLGGIVDVDSLAALPNLRSVSVMNNSFDGPIPSFKRLGLLRGIYLSGNRYSGEVPGDGFEGMGSLKKVYLAGNRFSGDIPASLASLGRLVELDLEGNLFSGEIPDFAERDWVFLDLANNLLEGKVPRGLREEDPSVFAGNKDLCGGPLKACKSNKKLIIIIATSVSSALLLSLILTFFCLRNRTKAQPSKRAQAQKPPTVTTTTTHNAYQQKAQPPEAHTVRPGGGEAANLFFVRKDGERFDLQELLRASAETLGSGGLGPSYRAALPSGKGMVVKRFRQMGGVGRDEFHEYMTRLGRLDHPNLLPLVAFYYRKEEKLLVSEFVDNGSLASHLHEKRAPGEAGLDWPTRLKIIKGVARGLSYLYAELPITLPHGHLKSSNVLLDPSFEPLLTDYALVPVVNKDHAHQSMVAYKSPESSHGGRATRKTDVWSLGILILEALTGKFPANYLKQGKGASADLAAWVNSVVREEWTGEVFDKGMRGTRRGEGEMLKLLRIGMCCCEWTVHRRWDIREAADKIGELKERDSDADDFSNSFVSDADVYSSRAMTDDDFSFSVVASPQ